MADIAQEIQAGESAVTREPKEPSGLQTVSHRGRHKALGTLGLSSAIQHHSDELCGTEKGVNQGTGPRGGVHQGPGDHKTTKVA